MFVTYGELVYVFTMLHTSIPHSINGGFVDCVGNYVVNSAELLLANMPILMTKYLTKIYKTVQSYCTTMLK